MDSSDLRAALNSLEQEFYKWLKEKKGDELQSCVRESFVSIRLVMTVVEDLEKSDEKDSGI